MDGNSIDNDIEGAKQLIVEDWRMAWKWLSVRFFALLGAMATFQGAMHDSATDMGILTSSKWYSYTMLVAAVLGVVGRLLPQPVAQAVEKAAAVASGEVEVAHYADGTSATGPGPLPVRSPGGAARVP